jgi:hypothetical protein
MIPFSFIKQKIIQKNNDALFNSSFLMSHSSFLTAMYQHKFAHPLINLNKKYEEILLETFYLWKHYLHPRIIPLPVYYAILPPNFMTAFCYFQYFS